MALSDIIGQEKALNILKGCIAKNRIPHALVFAGDEGIGKRLAAINFAKALNCRKTAGTDGDDLFSLGEEDASQPSGAEEVEACDKCPSCRKIATGNHPDIFIIEPEGDAGQITVAAIRQLEEALSYKPYEGGWKIAIIDNADRLNPSAANAFLRTLEEPAPQSILILISSRPDMLLSTILSRCRRINFSPLPIETMSNLLEKKFGQSEGSDSALLSLLSGGRPGYALNENLIARRDWSFNIFKQMLGNIEEAWDDRDAMEEWFDWGQLLLRDIAVYKATGNADFIINKDLVDEIAAISEGAVLKDILKLARELYNIKKKLNFNLNKQLTLNYTNLLIRKMLGRSSQ